MPGRAGSAKGDSGSEASVEGAGGGSFRRLRSGSRRAAVTDAPAPRTRREASTGASGGGAGAGRSSSAVTTGARAASGPEFSSTAVPAARAHTSGQARNSPVQRLPHAEQTHEEVSARIAPVQSEQVWTANS